MVITGWTRLVILALGGCAVGTLVAGAWAGASKGSWFTPRSQVVTYPAAYQLPKMPGGTSLRMAMIHDVLLERYTRHGEAWYGKRVADARKIVEAEQTKAGGPSVAMLEAMDDEAVGLENLHKSDEAAAVMREKLKLLPAIKVAIPPGMPEGDPMVWEEMEVTRAIETAVKLTPEMRQQYTARANLGTSLIHGNFSRMMAGDKVAQAQMEEGVRYIKESMAINPGAHFGRETWQAMVVQYFLVCRQFPLLMTTYDMVGDDLSTLKPGTAGARYFFEGLREKPEVLDARVSIEERLRLRQPIVRVGVEVGWISATHADIAGPAHFDEPALALMGMWMLGGGANPNSAMALANIALQVGQLEIAWDGYERALELQEGFSSDAGVRAALVNYCGKQQDVIGELEARAGVTADVSAWKIATRKRHQEELAWALQYRAEYQAWEAKQIAAGVGLEDGTFYAGFYKDHGAIASPVGHADENAVRYFAPDGMLDGLPAGLALGGVFMLLGALTAKRTA